MYDIKKSNLSLSKVNLQIITNEDNKLQSIVLHHNCNNSKK